MDMTIEFLLRRVILPLGLALIPTFHADAQAPRQPIKPAFMHERDVDAGFLWPKEPRWEHGLLAGYYNNHSNGPVLYTIGADGYRNETLFTLPDGAIINVFDVALSSKGEMAVVADALTADTRAAMLLVRISSDRKSQTITRTWPYGPTVVTFAPDGTLWTIGVLKNEDNRAAVATHVLRRFDSSGQLLSSMNIMARRGNIDEESYLRSSPDRVGWFTRYGEYFEFSLDGKQIGRYEAPEGTTGLNLTGFALSEEDMAVVGRTMNENEDFLVLDRSTKTWTPAALPKEFITNWAGVIGFDGPTLVTTRSSGNIRRFTTR